MKVFEANDTLNLSFSKRQATIALSITTSFQIWTYLESNHDDHQTLQFAESSYDICTYKLFHHSFTPLEMI